MSHFEKFEYIRNIYVVSEPATLQINKAQADSGISGGLHLDPIHPGIILVMMVIPHKSFYRSTLISEIQR